MIEQLGGQLVSSQCQTTRVILKIWGYLDSMMQNTHKREEIKKEVVRGSLPGKKIICQNNDISRINTETTLLGKVHKKWIKCKLFEFSDNISCNLFSSKSSITNVECAFMF